MRYIIYVDVFFIVNMIMDFVLLKVTAHFIKPHTTLMRCLLGGAAGGLLSVVSLMLSYENMLVHMLITYIFTVTVMVYIAYGRVSPRQFILRVGWLYLVTIIFGGTMNLVYSYTYFGYMIQAIIGTLYKNPINIFKLFMFTGIAYIGVNGVAMLLNRQKKQQNYVKAHIKIRGKEVSVTALIDTGNTLMCPYYKKYVHVASFESIKSILEGVDIYNEKYRLVPFNSLGKRRGMIEVIECEEIKVHRQEENIYYEKCPAIGIYKGELTGSNDYQMLLNSVVENNNI